jgi:hypothetical protein
VIEKVVQVQSALLQDGLTQLDRLGGSCSAEASLAGCWM